MVFSPGIRASRARTRVGAPAFTTASSASASRRASRAGSSCAVPAAVRSLAAVDVMAARSSAGVGAGATSKGLTVASRRLLASPISASLACWSDGMKLDSVITCPTSGCWEMRSASASATASDTAGTSIVLGDVCGFFIRSNRVETDSTLGLRRSSGSESKRRNTIITSDMAAATVATTITWRRWAVMKSSTRPSAAKPTSSYSPGGFSSIRSAGSMVIDRRNATIMPMPATRPSSATPV